MIHIEPYEDQYRNLFVRMYLSGHKVMDIREMADAIEVLLDSKQETVRIIHYRRQSKPVLDEWLDMKDWKEYLGSWGYNVKSL